MLILQYPSKLLCAVCEISGFVDVFDKWKYGTLLSKYYKLVQFYSLLMISIEEHIVSVAEYHFCSQQSTVRFIFGDTALMGATLLVLHPGIK